MIYDVADDNGEFELQQLDGKGKKVVLITAPINDGDDHGAILAALVRVAGDLLVAEYENQHSILNDAERAKNQAEAFAAGFKKMTEGSVVPPMHGPASIFGPPEEVAGIPCENCGSIIAAGSACLRCELEAEAAKEKKPDSQ